MSILLHAPDLFLHFTFFYLFAEPNNFWGFEGCVTLNAGSGHWNDVYCSRPQNGYICKKTEGGDWSTPRPTDMPEGHCPSDHFEYRGYCYKFVGKSTVMVGWILFQFLRALARDSHCRGEPFSKLGIFQTFFCNGSGRQILSRFKCWKVVIA